MAAMQRAHGRHEADAFAALSCIEHGCPQRFAVGDQLRLGGVAQTPGASIIVSKTQLDGNQLVLLPANER